MSIETSARPLDGMVRFIRYGFMPNRLRYCGGDENRLLFEHAVEEVIDEHYRGQAERLGDADPALTDKILAFRDDELAHRDKAVEMGATDAPGYDLLSAAVKTGSRLAIWLSTRI